MTIAEARFTTARSPVEMSSGSKTNRALVPAAMAMTNEDGQLPNIDPNYSKVGETLRYNTPSEMQCSMFCGGRRCKYESPNHWKPDDMAVEGIYSHWVTDDFLAMARPNSGCIEKFKLVEQFQKLGIKSIFNLQTSGEHASCGPKLLSSGFTYDPNEFMSNDIFFYNFAWRDYAETSVPNLLDMVKVLAFAVSEGKVAVHCHAGLGRTGVLAAAYLIYNLRVRANDAIRYVRLKRPGSVQTRRQIQCVKEFEAYFLPQCLVFSNKPIVDQDKKTGRFTIEQYLKRQRHVLHGAEARVLKHIPKIVHKICERLLRLCNGGPIYDIKDDYNFTKNFLAADIENAKAGNASRVGRFAQLSNNGSPLSNSVLPSTNSMDSIIATRWSSQSHLAYTDDDSGASSTTSSGYPTPLYGGTRPASETNSYMQSCSSALDDGRLDELLGDGIKDQKLDDNLVTHELIELTALQIAVENENLPYCDRSLVVESLLECHTDLIFLSASGGKNEWSSPNVMLLDQYRSTLNYRVSAWDKIDTETNLWVLTAMLFEWLEHLKSPILGKDSITYLVIHCDNLEAALRKLPTHVCFILEYFIRFVARLRPLEKNDCQDVMRRLLVAMTHQSVVIRNVAYPSGKKFPKLRGGTAESTLKFFVKFYEFILEREAESLESPEPVTNHRLHQMASSDYEEESFEAQYKRNQSRSSARRSDTRAAFNLNQSLRDLPIHKENGLNFDGP